MIVKLLVILECAFKFPFKSLGIGAVDNVNVSYSMAALIWTMFGSDVVCLKVGVSCLILALQSVNKQLEITDCGRHFRLMGDCLGFYTAGLTFALFSIKRRLWGCGWRHQVKLVIEYL